MKNFDKIKVGDKVNTPKGEGIVTSIVADSLLVELGDDEWWFCPHFISPEQRPTAKDNFDEKIQLGAALANLKAKREKLTKAKEKYPCNLFLNAECMRELEWLVYPDKELWGEITASCENILDMYIGAIDLKFEKLKAEFEKL